MRRNAIALAILTSAALLTGCQSVTSEPDEPRRDVMDLTDSAPPPPPPAPVAPPPPAELPPPPAPVVPEPRTHVIQEKETLYGLAIKYYGDAKQWPKIQAANPGLIPERMPVGKTIVIP